MNLGIIALCSGAFMMLAIPVHLYVTFTKLEIVEAYFKKSSFIVDGRQLLRCFRWQGKPCRLMMVAFVLCMPMVFHWRKIVVLDEVESVPKKLRFLIVSVCFSQLINMVVMFAVWASGFYDS